jgi:hypothetical protein
LVGQVLDDENGIEYVANGRDELRRSPRRIGLVVWQAAEPAGPAFVPVELTSSPFATAAMSPAVEIHVTSSMPHIRVRTLPLFSQRRPTALRVGTSMPRRVLLALASLVMLASVACSRSTAAVPPPPPHASPATHVAPDAGGLTCEYGGKTYQVGDQYPDLESCNDCTCVLEPGGRALTSCTEIYCPK